MAKDVITRFKLETTAYDSKLRDAAKGLADYTKTATAAGKEFGKFTQSNVETARALGNIAPSANNAKDKVKELVGAFNEATKAYNHLTKEQQQSDFGKAMSESLSKLKVQIAEAKKELYSLGDSTKGAGGGLFSGDKMSGMLQVFGGNVMTKVASMGAGLVAELHDAVSQGIELAKQGEGIRIAFERLGRGDILDGLREATHGTVTDLELMKAAVKFNDFKLPVEELGTMLAFAQQKAKDTGQSVDYMVDSIVTGLGRKSLMILDNLGLSATEIKDKMAETGDMTKAVGEIIREQMSKAGDYVETAADRAAQANVSLQNKMEELGRKFAPLEEASTNFWTSMKIGILDVVGGPLATLLNKLTEAGRLMNAYGQMGGSGKVGRMTSILAGASEGNRQSIYQQQQERFWRYINPREQQIKDIRAWQRGERGDALQKRIGAITDKYGSLDVTKIQAEVDAAKKMLSEYQQGAKQILNPVKADIDTKGAEQNVESLKVKLIELQAQRKKAIAAGDTDLSKNLAKQISQVKADIKGLGGSTTSKGSSTAKKEQTELQQNQKRINDLTQKYVDLMSEASMESKPLTNEQRDRAASIKKEIRDLERRNGQLKLYQEQAKGKFLGSGAFKQQLEVDVAVNNKKIEELEKQLINLDGITIDPKTVTITATDEALPKLREIQGITIDDKTMTVKAETADALRALQGIEGVNISPKSVTITATDEVLQKLREIQGITINDKTMTVTADTQEALQALQGIEGVTVDTKTVKVTAETDEARQKVEELKRQIAELKDQNIQITAAMGSIGMPLSETPRMGVTDVTYGKGKNQFVPAPLMPTMDDVVRQRGGNLLDEKAMKAVNNDLYGDKGNKSDKNTTKSLLNGISQLTDGLEKIGIDVPDEIEAVIGVIQGVMQVIEAINTIIGVTQTTALAANTSAMVSLEAALWANTARSWGFFSNGGIVPKFADGGTIGRAALGIAIPGNSMSGDNLRLPVDGGRGVIGVNSGEVILNRAQQGVIASALDGGGAQGMQLSATIRGEDIRLAINNNGRRTGRGEYVQSTRRR